MKHKIAAAILALLAAAFMWQAFAQTDCRAVCKKYYDDCMKLALNAGWERQMAEEHCNKLYADCLKQKCK